MKFEKDVLLKDYTTLNIGGPAERFYRPQTEADLQEILTDAHKNQASLCILGNGSNMLFDDDGYDGWIIYTADGLKGIELVEDDGQNVLVKAKAGTTNQELAEWLADRGYDGYAFASGIPGTIGGAVIMNAGAYDGEICDVIVSCRWMDENGTIHESPADELDLSYRHSRFTDSFGIVLEAVFRFTHDDPVRIHEKIQELHDRRWAKQPMEDASAGSTFKRPVKGYASALIQECGLQGMKSGGAMVSTKHAGFLINAGNATSKDFLDLVSKVQAEVKRQKDVDLELEVKHITRSSKE